MLMNSGEVSEDDRWSILLIFMEMTGSDEEAWEPKVSASTSSETFGNAVGFMLPLEQTY